MCRVKSSNSAIALLLVRHSKSMCAVVLATLFSENPVEIRSKKCIAGVHSGQQTVGTPGFSA